MKTYLVVTGTLFGLVAVAHVLRTFAEWSRWAADPWFILEGPGIGIVAGAVSLWAWTLVRALSRQ